MTSIWEQVKLEQTWCYVHAGVAAVTAFVIFIIGSVALCAARRRHDPSRVAFSWLKGVFAFEIVGLVLFAVSDFALSNSALLVYWKGDTDGVSPGYTYNSAERNTITAAYDVYSPTVSVSALFRRIADVLLMVTLVELGNGLLFASKRQRRMSQKVLRWFTVSSGVILIIIAIAHTVLANTVMREQWYATFELRTQKPLTKPSPNDSSYFGSLLAQSTSYRRLEGTYNILSFFTAVGVLVYASITLHFYAKVQPSRVCAVNFLLAALCSFFRWLWFLVVSALWILPDTGATVPNLLGITYGGSAFLDIVLFAVILLILFSTAVLKKTGLWTTLQPWMGGVPPSMVMEPQLAHGQPPQQSLGLYPAPNGLQPLSDYQPQHRDQYRCLSPQEIGHAAARHEAPSEATALELGQGDQRQNVHEMKA